MSSLPYVTAPGNIEKAFLAIKSAAVPERVSQDFVKTILQIKGGSGNQMTSFLKKIGFVNTDGAPSDLYKKFRNPQFSGWAASEALKQGYGPLYLRNEYMHKLNDDQLRGIIIEETGQGDDSSTVGLILAAIKYIKKFADFNSTAAKQQTEPNQEITVRRDPEPLSPPDISGTGIGLNLGYTINLNLPATSDIAVFNAIFKSLKENLLKNE
ncbi:DUF5343 domain-containing protein [Terriglobus tenax]|uniref:DUF5343 domain-containing protein n=1 Tax=Terriglobus tenax TaxID=1111115 RepID=UPI0021E09512|nr:DUF5343 domain-containing protein [Terriglobus tenax]